MMRGFLFCFVLIVFSCKSGIPKDVLQPSSMKSVLWDVLLADEMSAYYSTTDSSFATLQKHLGLYKEIFRIHKTDEAAFRRSLNFYMEHPAYFKPILDSMQNSGDRMQTNLDTSIKIKPTHPDSLKKNLLMHGAAAPK